MTVKYENQELLAEDSFENLDLWHHEGAGELKKIDGNGLKMHCYGSYQGGPGCMAFFKQDFPDQVAYEYTIDVKSHGGLVINYLAIRGINGEDMLTDSSLEPRTGIMRNYYGLKWGLQSYHISFSRFNDKGIHSDTSNWRRNPGMVLVGHGPDQVTELNKKYRIRITKDKGHLQFFVNDQLAHAMIDRNTSEMPLPDHGKFGIRLIGSDVQADFYDFKVYRIKEDTSVDFSKKDEV